MPEHLPKQHYDIPRRTPAGPEADKQRLQYVETLVYPGDTVVRELRPPFSPAGEPRIAAYIRTSALARDGVDALQLEDLRAVSKVEDGTKRWRGRVIPGDSKYALVDVNQLEESDGDVPGFAVLTQDQEYEFGRGTDSVRDFSMGPGTSRRHFKLKVVDSGSMVTLQDLGSLNGLAMLELTHVTADGTPVHMPDDLEFDLPDLDKRLQRIDAIRATADQKLAARELLVRGTLGGKTIDYRPVTRNGYAALRSREFVADMALRDFEVAKLFVEKEIVGLHGTRAVALLGMMERGVQSAAALRAAGQMVVAGEHFYQYGDGQASTSFSALAGHHRAVYEYAIQQSSKQVRSIAEVKQQLLSMVSLAEAGNLRACNELRRGIYKAMARDNFAAAERIEREPESLFTQMLQHDFPVVIGVSRTETEWQQNEHRLRLLSGAKDYDEFRIKSEEPRPMEAFPVVAVPQHYVRWVQELMKYFGHPTVSVVPLEAFPQKGVQ